MAFKFSTVFNNFARGKADHDLNGRFDLPIYPSAADIFTNFFGNFKGNAIFRNGFENMVKFQDCAMIEFKFNKEQSYICVFYNLKVKFLTYDSGGNFGFVQNGGGDLEVTTPYSLAEAKQLDWTQNADVMYLTHPSYAPRKLTRVAADNFTVATFTRTLDPFTSTDNYPALCQFYGGALFYAATNNKLTTVWRSKVADYDNMTTGSNDDDGLEFAVAELTERFQWLQGGNKSLIGGSSQGLVSINGGTADDPITPSTVSATLTNTDGTSDAHPLRKEDLLFYINQDKRNCKYFSYDILTEAFKTDDANVVSYDISVGLFKRMVYKQDRNDLIWIVNEDGTMCALNFNLREKIVGWSKHESQATFEDCSMITNNEGVAQLFTLMKFGSDYFICRLAEQPDYLMREDFYSGDNNEETDDQTFARYMSEKLRVLNYLDLSSYVSNDFTSTLTYTGDTEVGSAGTIGSSASDFSSGDVGKYIAFTTVDGSQWGIFLITGYNAANNVDVEVVAEPHATSYASWRLSFTTITGLTDFIGQTVAVVADGGYVGDFVVNGSGEVALEREAFTAWVGFDYEGLIKTFNLGFQIQGVNTQITKKHVNKLGIRFVNSAGGLVGTSLYRMSEVQQYKLTDFLDMPPLPMDGTEFASHLDTFDENKVLYIKQNKPLPMNVTAVVAEVNYGTKT